MSDAVRDAYWGIAAKGVCSGDAGARAAYCAMLDGLHATMPDPCDPSIAFPAIWMGHADLVMTIYRKCIHPANMFGLMSLWTDVDPIRPDLAARRVHDLRRGSRPGGGVEPPTAGPISCPLTRAGPDRRTN